MKATIFFILVVVVGLCEARKPKKTQKQGEGLWKKKQAAVQARTDFNKLWQSTLERDEKDMKDRPLKGPGGREFRGLKDIFTDDTKTQRFLLFQNARNEIGKLRKQRKFEMEENFFALMTESEKKSYLGVNMTLNTRLEQSLQVQLVSSTVMWQPPLPKHSLLRKSRSKRSEDSLDWREYGAVTSVKNQGSCGSCWAFGSVAAMEGAYFLATGNAKNFSEQQVLDCNADYGCSGGWWPTVWDDVRTNSYIALMEDYAYVGTKTAESCSRKSTNAIEDAAVTGYNIIREHDAESTMLNHLQSYGPIAVCINVDDSIYYYKSGSIESCIGDNCNHLVTLVGYDANNLIIKNSWGTGWGLDGYLQLARGCSGESGYSYWASYPYIVSSGGGSDDPTEEPTPTSGSEDEVGEEYVVVMNQTQIVKKKDYSLSEAGVQVGDIFTIKGTEISSSTKKWFVNLFSGNDIVFHIEFQRSKDKYRMNHRENGVWGNKIAENYPNSVEENGDFTLEIEVTGEGFESTINGEPLTSCLHRLDVSAADEIEVGGPAADYTSLSQLRPDTMSAEGGRDDGAELCLDFQLHCSYWAEEGYCQDDQYSVWMHQNCQKSCGIC
ncbi:hypothetical protein ACHWQZ_G014215 [Mnemiopsis leidyi]